MSLRGDNWLDGGQAIRFFYFFLILFLSILLPATIFSKPVCAQNDILYVHFLDVGFGDSILIQFSDSTTLLIDAGSKEHQSSVQNYLKRLGIPKIHTALITHPHENHFGAFESLLDHFDFQRFFINGEIHAADKGYETLLDKLKQKKIPVHTVFRGQRIEGLPDAITLQVLNPGKTTGRLNAESLALLLTYQQTVFLFLSDVETKEQDEIIALMKDVSRVVCVQLPHHGGELSQKFKDTFKGKIFVVSTGPNAYGLPRAEFLRQIEGPVLRTDKNGSIAIETDGKKVNYVTEK